MAERLSPLILVGPTTVGKSEVAMALADTLEGDLINADRHYLYASEVFCLGLGLEPGEIEDGRKRHLYGGFSPEDDPMTPYQYVQQVATTVDKINDSGGVAVVEGCTRRYTMALLAHFGVEHAVNLTWASREGLEGMVERRIRHMGDLGLREETERGIDLGYADTFPMSALMYRVSRRVIEGTISPDDAQREMVGTWVDIATRHDGIYAALGMPRIKHDRANVKQTIGKILEIITTRSLQAERLAV